MSVCKKQTVSLIVLISFENEVSLSIKKGGAEAPPVFVFTSAGAEGKGGKSELGAQLDAPTARPTVLTKSCRIAKAAGYWFR